LQLELWDVLKLFLPSEVMVDSGKLWELAGMEIDAENNVDIEMIGGIIS